jgi:two-component sensor histidine kinase
LHFTWKETGLSEVVPPSQKGFGLKMIGLAAGHDLGGVAELEWLPEGLLFRLEFPAVREEKEDDHA